jgi:hypothetical protein
VLAVRIGGHERFEVGGRLLGLAFGEVELGEAFLHREPGLL